MNTRKADKKCGCDYKDIIKCLCALDQEIECVKRSLGHKNYFGRVAKEKILFCIVLREIGKIDKKIDQILRELDCGWTTPSDSDSTTSYYCDSD